MFKKSTVITFIAILTALVSFMLVTGYSFVSFTKNRVISNVYAGNIHLEGMNREQGVEKINEYLKKVKDSKVTLKYKEQERVLDLDIKDLHVDAEGIMDEALKYGNEGRFIKRWKEKKNIQNNKLVIPLNIYYDRSWLQKKVESILSDVTNSPIDAGYEINSREEIEITPSREGTRVDFKSLEKDLQEILNGEGEPEIHVSFINEKPGLTEKDIEKMGLKGLLSSYSTQFDPENISRTYNIRVSAASLDDTLVPPGEEISFNEIVGPRTEDTGYKSAKIILNSELVDGVGGGVCQVSSTLYNAVLLAGLEITERNNHSIPITYVPIGRDATVVDNYKDLRFKNNSDSYILIKSSVDYDNLLFKIYGNNVPPVSVDIDTTTEVLDPEVVYEENPQLKKGEEIVKQEGMEGYKVTGELTVTKNGRVDTHPLSESIYEPRDKIIVKGTKDPAEDEPDLPKPSLEGQ